MLLRRGTRRRQEGESIGRCGVMARERTASGIVIITAWRECVKPCFSETWVDVYNIATLLSTFITGAARLTNTFRRISSIAGLLRTTADKGGNDHEPSLVFVNNAKATLFIASRAKSVVETGIFGARDGLAPLTFPRTGYDSRRLWTQACCPKDWKRFRFPR